MPSSLIPLVPLLSTLSAGGQLFMLERSGEWFRPSLVKGCPSSCDWGSSCDLGAGKAEWCFWRWFETKLGFLSIVEIVLVDLAHVVPVWEEGVWGTVFRFVGGDLKSLSVLLLSLCSWGFSVLLVLPRYNDSSFVFIFRLVTAHCDSGRLSAMYVLCQGYGRALGCFFGNACLIPRANRLFGHTPWCGWA